MRWYLGNHGGGKMALQPGTVTLIGSGEMAPSMAKVHRAVRARVDGVIRPAFVDTPAGFETNVAAVAAKAVAYIERHVGAPCEVVSFRSAETATRADVDVAVGQLRRANYIFAGPGSPTYAVRNWVGTPVLDAIGERLRAGAHLVFASAASIAVGKEALPVYEIYKAGAPPHWIRGVDLLAPYGLQLAVVPHWDNAEGSGYDTRRCYIGEERFSELAHLLDPATTVLGIDEHTACTVDLAARECVVIGGGGVTVIQRGSERRLAAGERFSFDVVQGEAAAAKQPPVPQETAAPAARLLTHLTSAGARNGDGGKVSHSAASVFTLATAIEEAADQQVDSGLLAEARELLAQLLTDWGREARGAADPERADVGPFVDLLIEVRRKLRESGEWELADLIRDRLMMLGIVLQDGRAETAWKRA